MNFLSHLYLSGNSEGIIIGNFIADAVKGKEYEKFSSDIQNGILIHRKIDSFTDAHPIVEKSKKRLREKYRKYAGVIVDIYYDHCLAKNWKTYSSIELEEYEKFIYLLVEKHKLILPYNSQRFAQYMVKYNILTAYSEIQGIERVLKGMANRATFESKMEEAIHELQENYSLFEEEFNLFFPELQQYVDEQLKLL